MRFSHSTGSEKQRMHMASLKKRDGSSIAPAILSKFVERFSGKVFYPDTPAYDAARVIWNRRISKAPGLVAQCSSTHEIAQAVRFARDNDLAVARAPCSLSPEDARDLQAWCPNARPDCRGNTRPTARPT
jgi:hypothetical protein